MPAAAAPAAATVETSRLRRLIPLGVITGLYFHGRVGTGIGSREHGVTSATPKYYVPDFALFEKLAQDGIIEDT